jgi:hypothetical protein
MKSLEGYTIEQVKEMSYEELQVLAEAVGREMQAEDIRKKIINMIDAMDAQNTLIKS